MYPCDILSRPSFIIIILLDVIKVNYKKGIRFLRHHCKTKLLCHFCRLRSKLIKIISYPTRSSIRSTFCPGLGKLRDTDTRRFKRTNEKRKEKMGLTICFHFIVCTSSSWLRCASLPRDFIFFGSSFWYLQAQTTRSRRSRLIQRVHTPTQLTHTHTHVCSTNTRLQACTHERAGVT